MFLLGHQVSCKVFFVNTLNQCPAPSEPQHFRPSHVNHEQASSMLSEMYAKPTRSYKA
jgi:hypothetical protein